MFIEKAKGQRFNYKVLSLLRGKDNTDLVRENIRVLGRHKRRSWEEARKHANHHAEKREAFLTSLMNEAKLETDDTREQSIKSIKAKKESSARASRIKNAMGRGKNNRLTRLEVTEVDVYRNQVGWRVICTKAEI